MDRTEGWKLDREARARLLERFPPRYEQAVADHVTFMPGPGGTPMPETDHCTLVGHADDGNGVEAMVVKIAGSSDRPDGSTYHITWSLAPGRKAVESNDVIAAHGWQELPEPIVVPVRADWWPKG
ncbi:MAG TPA: hypothetical protein VF418_01745 [Sphingomonadaceae bacterium]